MCLSTAKAVDEYLTLLVSSLLTRDWTHSVEALRIGFGVRRTEVGLAVGFDLFTSTFNNKFFRTVAPTVKKLIITMGSNLQQDNKDGEIAEL